VSFKYREKNKRNRDIACGVMRRRAGRWFGLVKWRPRHDWFGAWTRALNRFRLYSFQSNDEKRSNGILRRSEKSSPQTHRGQGDPARADSSPAVGVFVAVSRGLSEQLAGKLEAEARLRRTGLIDPAQERFVERQQSPIDEHLKAFEESLDDNTGKHVKLTMFRVRRIIELRIPTFRRSTPFSIGACRSGSSRIL
jgi:hypothetical protein